MAVAVSARPQNTDPLPLDANGEPFDVSTSITFLAVASFHFS